MSKCKRCQAEISEGEIHIFWGGETRRVLVEKEFKTKVSLCGMPLTDAEVQPSVWGLSSFHSQPQ